MTLSTVTWRQALAAVAAVLVSLGALVVLVRADGLAAVDATTARATRWFVHQETGRIVLADGYRGRALATLDAGTSGEQVRVTQGGSGAYLVDPDAAAVRVIDSAALRIGPPRAIGTLGGTAITSAGASGLVVVDRAEGEATVLPTGGEPINFDVRAEPGGDVLVAPDGAVWSELDGRIERRTSTGATEIELDGAAVDLSLVGSRPLLLDRASGAVSFDDGAWVRLPTAADGSELVLQEPGPDEQCGWVGSGDDVWCVGTSGITHSATVPDLDIGGGDRLAIAGDAAVVVGGAEPSIERFDWRAEKRYPGEASVPEGATLDVTPTVDLIWIDDPGGDLVWAASPWGLEPVRKDDVDALELRDDGQVVDGGRSATRDVEVSDEGVAAEPQDREPDDDGIDDPPVAVDDFVTARGGTSVQIPVTANDYDPDGEAVAVWSVEVPGHGEVEIGDATTVVYNPTPGFVGVDMFDYTIVDGNGTPATATVRVEILPPDAANRPPVGGPDEAETGPRVPVTVDVLANDVDPERDPLAIGSFTFDEDQGVVTETRGPSGLAALEYLPAPGFEGRATFSYRPVDTFEAEGDAVQVTVDVARTGDANREPVTRPDAIRLRRGVLRELAVLANDRDPDGDPLVLSGPRRVPDGLDVRVDGQSLEIIAQAGAPPLITFSYQVDDGNGHEVPGQVLVRVVDDDEPNGPPLVVPDTATAVIDTPTLIDVTANDSDPDGDTLTVIEVTQPEGRGPVVILDDGLVQFTPERLAEGEEANARFSYVVTDGFGNEVSGDVTVTVLPEPLRAPPFARDDSISTFVDEPVVIDVLRNDGDPSGGRPTLVGQPGCPAGGRAETTTDGRVRFTPPARVTGTFRCTYEVANDQGLRDSASILITVLPPDTTNRPPVITPLGRVVAPGGTVSVDLTSGATDPDGPNERLEVVSSTAPRSGSAVRDGNLLTYTAGSSEGLVRIRYSIADRDGAVAAGDLTVQIREPRRRPPVATNDSATVEADSGPKTIDVLANDSDPDGSPAGLRITSVGGSGDAATRFDGPNVTITPRTGFQGTIRVPYTISDPDGLTASATVSLLVTPPANRAPVAIDDALQVPNGGAGRVAVLANDSDPDGDPLAVTIVGGPDAGLGSAVVDGGAISFTAVPNAAGTTTITYRVSDGELDATARVLVTVLPCQQSAPVARDAFLTTGYRTPIAVDLRQYATNGEVVDVVGPPGYAGGVYTPPAGENGNVTISYAVENQCGQRAAGAVVIDVNQSPVVQPVSRTIGRTSPLTLPVALLASDDEPLTIVRSDGAPAWVTTTADRLVVDPTAGAAVGTYSWSTVVQDPGGLTASVPVTITVTNVAPVAAPDQVDLRGGGTVRGDLLANDNDPDGPNAALRIQAVPNSFPLGRIEIVEDGRDVRIIANGSSGTATFTYRIVDGDGAVSDPATVTVVGPPPPPTTAPPTTAPPTTAPPTTVPPTTAPPTTSRPTTTTTSTTQP